MDKKRPMTENELEYYANLSDSEFDAIFGEDGNDSSYYEHGNDSSDYEPSVNSSDSDDEVVSEPEDEVVSEPEDEVVSEPEDEVVPDPDDNDDEPQATTSNPNDNLWTDIEQNPELFIFQENVGLKLDTSNFTVQTLVDLFFSEEFLALLVEQTNLYAAQEIAKRTAIKNYELCESDGLVMKIKIYRGKSEETDHNLGHTTDVVLHLLEDYLDKGYTLYMDNFYNSVTLTNLLNTRKTYVCGTLRNKRKGNPRDVVHRKLKKGECIWQQNGPVTVCKWKDKRDVLTISNMHVVEMVEVSNRNRKLSMKPNIIRDYNKGMSGIDRSDQMLSYYTSLRKTIRWPKKVSLHIIEIYLHNAHKIFQKVTFSKIKLIKFREEFVVALIGEEIQPVSKKIRLQELHYLESLPPTEKKQRPTKPCRICTQAKKRRETRYFCPTCEEKPALHVKDCFKKFHKQ
ncbi:hypothetical protein JTB14_015626 [Gonioctena quinquepunctata]|nr:hypothetical protein JTB14_015626 [Gonioctena quinquepunctata]